MTKRSLEVVHKEQKSNQKSSTSQEQLSPPAAALIISSSTKNAIIVPKISAHVVYEFPNTNTRIISKTTLCNHPLSKKSKRGSVKFEFFESCNDKSLYFEFLIGQDRERGRRIMEKRKEWVERVKEKEDEEKLDR